MAFRRESKLILGQALGRSLSLSLSTANRALEPDRIIGDKRKREIAGDGNGRAEICI